MLQNVLGDEETVISEEHEVSPKLQRGKQRNS